MKKCDVCGAEHSEHQAHRFAKPVKQLVSQTPVTQQHSQPVVTQSVSQVCCEHLKRIADLEAEVKRLKSDKKFDRKTYHREYMRRQRAKRRKGESVIDHLLRTNASTNAVLPDYEPE